MNSGSTLRAILWIVTLNWSQAFYLLIPKMRNTWITLIAFGMWSWWCEGMETMEITIDGIQNANPSASEAHTPSFNEASLISINSNGQANSSATFPSHPFGVELNSNKVNRQHPYVINIPGSRTTACAAIFRSLSSRVIDIWWEDGNGGLEQGSLYPGQESTTNSYQGHVFFFTAHNNKSDEIARVLINPSQALYVINDEQYPAAAEVIARTRAEESFSRDYLNKTGVMWRHYFGSDGPRPPPILNMWPADNVGVVHSVQSSHGFWECDGLQSKCQDSKPIQLNLECISTAPRAFIVENFLSDFEADSIVALASPKVKLSTVGSSDGGGVRQSSTRTSHNTWIPRWTSNVTETITKRVADLLGIDEALLTTDRNAEDMQVVHYINGQKYDSHHDWGVSGYPESRFITMLMYLNTQVDPGAGGETSFPKGGQGGGIKVRPVKGTALIFYNLLPDGNGDDLSLHAALPAIRGEKWLANYWIWDPKRK